jgi:hypothetical protein
MIRFHSTLCILAAFAAAATARAQSAPQSQGVIVIERDGDRIEVRLPAGDAHPSVTINGKPVAAREWHTKDGKHSATAGDYNISVTPGAGWQAPLVYSWGNFPDSAKNWPLFLNQQGSLWRYGQQGDKAAAERPYIGVQVGSLPPALAAQLDLDADRCVLILSAVAGGPAEAAGVKANDILMAIDGNDAVTDEGLTKAVADKKPGDKMPLSILRKGHRQQIEVKVGKQAAAANPSFLEFPKGNNLWRTNLLNTPLTFTSPVNGYQELFRHAEHQGEEAEHADATVESLQRELAQIKKLCERLEKQLGSEKNSGR